MEKRLKFIPLKLHFQLNQIKKFCSLFLLTCKIQIRFFISLFYLFNFHTENEIWFIFCLIIINIYKNGLSYIFDKNTFLLIY